MPQSRDENRIRQPNARQRSRTAGLCAGPSASAKPAPGARTRQAKRYTEQAESMRVTRPIRGDPVCACASVVPAPHGTTQGVVSERVSQDEKGFQYSKEISWRFNLSSRSGVKDTECEPASDGATRGFARCGERCSAADRARWEYWDPGELR